MNINNLFKPRSLLNLFVGTVGLAGLAFGAFYLSTLFASRSVQTGSQLQVPASQPLSPTPTVATSQTDPTMGWKVYVNSAYRYSIKYPPNWSFSEDATVSPADRTIYFYDATRLEAKNQIYQPYEGISIRIRDNSKGLLLEEWADQLYREMSGGLKPPESLPKKRIFIEEYHALKVAEIPSRVTEYFVLIPYDQRILIAGLDSGMETTGEGQQPKYEEIFFRMLKTLRFLQDR